MLRRQDCMKDGTVIKSIPVLHAKMLYIYIYIYRYPHYFHFSPTVCTPIKVIRHVTSDFDVCEVDLDMQVTFPNAAPRSKSGQ